MSRTAGLLLIGAFVLVAGCGSSSPTGPSGASLTGTWKAIKAEFVNASNSGQRVDIVAGGTSLTLTLESSGSYTQRIVDPGQGGQTTTGTWSASKDVLTLKPVGMSGEIQFDMDLSGSTLSLSGGHVWFDANLDGRDEEALAYLTLTRQ